MAINDPVEACGRGDQFFVIFQGNFYFIQQSQDEWVVPDRHLIPFYRGASMVLEQLCLPGSGLVYQ